METIEKLDGKTLNLVKENISALKSLFPEAFSEEKIDFDKLRLLLGDEMETSTEKYSFNWHGKSEAIKLALKQSSGTLKPCVKDSKNWDTTKNLYIEGDNLEVLRILQGAYRNKVKMIYIDPPYNTGKDFVYKDSFKDNIKHYKEQVQETGKANPETAGRYHTNWLNMMYPRLKLARNLLKDDGVIFISIDDHEVHNLRKICDEVFGEENFIGCFIWKRRVSSAMSENNVSTDHEYVTVYQKSFSSFSGLAKDFNKYTNPDNDQRGPWIADNLTVGMTASMRPNQAYNLINPETKISYPYNPNRVWAYIPSSMDQLIAEGRIIFPKDSSKRPMLKRFQYELKTENNPFSSILIDKVGLNTEATKDVQTLFDLKLFEYSKPLSLLKTLISQIDHNDLILDFFSGSATTAHAVMKLNAEDGGNRRYIMVQLPEKTPEDHEARKAGYETITEIGKERIRRAGEKIKEEFKDKEGIENLDIGFKVFKLDESNFTAWNTNTSNLTQALSEMKNTIMGSSSSEDAFYEVLLKLGIDISLPVEEIEIKGKKIYSLSGHYILACFDKNLSLDIIEEMARLSSETETIVLSDDVFKDNLTKLNAEETLKRNHVKFLRVV